MYLLPIQVNAVGKIPLLQVLRSILLVTGRIATPESSRLLRILRRGPEMGGFRRLHDYPGRACNRQIDSLLHVL
jgi:hypothetical protein